MPIRSTGTPRTRIAVRASFSTSTRFADSAAGMSWSSSWLPRMPKTPCGADSGSSASADGWTNCRSPQQSVLGHLSGKRFIIGDEALLSYRVSEKPPDFTTCSVVGTEAFIGQPGGIIAGNFPQYKALGVDFDLWRQYGFRQEREFDKPFFWDAEGQCAPYAKMLLARQYKELLSASADVVGNEFYQLGDVVYLSDLQMLFYVHGISHRFNYEGDFSTSLSLSYGHSVGEYIPTPLDVIGKSLSNKASMQGAFRTRRGQFGDRILATVKFSESDNGMDGLLGGQDGKRNFQMLSNALILAKEQIDQNNSNQSAKIVVIAFGNSGNELNQKNRVATVVKWLSAPIAPGDKSDLMSAAVSAMSGSSELTKLAIPKDFIKREWLQQLVTQASDLSKTDLDLLKAGVAASDQSWTLDPTLSLVVEVRIRQAPAGGWPQGATNV
jgi:hypothetical protein